MKNLLFILLLPLMVVCGQEQQPVDISMTTIVWQGPIESDTSMLAVYNGTASCLLPFGFSRPNYPYIVITKDPFICGTYGYRYGCVDKTFSRIYIQQDMSCNLAINKQYCDPSLLQHEVVHWITRQDNAHHKADYFQLCVQSPSVWIID